MKKVTAISAFTIFLVVIVLPFSFTVNIVSAQSAGYSIQHVNHQVEVMYSGHVIIRDTIQVAGQLTDGFLIGFPYEYGSHVLRSVAYDANSVLPMDLGVQLEGRSGFYGAKISFPQTTPQVFTVVFILSNDLVSQDLVSGVFSVDFPVYPSFAADAANVNVTLVVPGGAKDVTIMKEDGEVTTTNFVKENLAAFTYSPATATFLPGSNLQLVDIKKVSRTITVNPVGDITSSDTYYIVSKSPATYVSFELSLPLSASNFVGRDEFGRVLSIEALGNRGNAQVFNVTFASSLDSGESAMLTAEYTLPHVSPEQTSFTLNFDLFPYFNYYIDEASVTIIPPEGARFTAPQLTSIDPSLTLTRGIFQDTLSINREGISYIDQAVPSENALQITYDYNLLWLSFRPTLWAWLLAVGGCIILTIYRRPKPSAPTLRIEAPKLPIVAISSDDIRTFTEAYEEKSRITSELKLLDARAQKGKIPRRRYKVQRRTFEVRLEALSKNITELKKLFRRGGGLYADLIRQLELAETELDEVETEIRSVEARHRRGELPLEEYKKHLADYQRRKEKAETTINGILLRLREEIR